jgi:hypothetical protein
MDSNNAVLIFAALFILAIVVIGAFWAIQRGRASFEGSVKTALGEGSIKTSKEAPPQGPVQTQFGGSDNAQESVKEAVSKQTQLGGKGNKQSAK